MVSDTELRLSFWRDGSTKAERLAAAVLDLSGYEDIDPQSPLGGPDGKKDILCQKGGLTWIGAVYFPNSPVRFTAIRKKFASDLSGVPGNRAGFVFITNQTLSPDQRRTLAALALDAGKESDIVHLQELTNMLDSPSGYGVRLQFLRIGMTIEEQLSWAVENDSQTAKAVATNTRELLAMRALIERMSSDQTHILRTLNVTVPGGLATPDLISVSSFAKSDTFASVSANMTPALILLFHRLTCFDLPSRMVGQLRTREIWLADREGKKATHAETPPPDEVSDRLVGLCDAWNQGFAGLRSKAARLEALARFHARLLLIHPFLDGNGRCARAILMQQCLDLFGRAEMTLMKKGADYYQALRLADRGEYAELAALIDPIVSG